MPKSLENILAFSGGEFSPLMDARIDHPKYSVACRQMQNMIALRQGGATRRPGTIFKAMAKYADNDVFQYAARLMPFQFSPSTSFMLEFGHQYVRFYSNQQQVTISSAPTWVILGRYIVGDFVEDPTDANNIYYCTSKVPSSVLEPHLDPAHWVPQTIYEVPAPYNGRETNGPSIFDVDVWRIVGCQINDVIYLVHPSYPVYKLERFADTDWRMSRVVFDTPALLDVNATGITIAASATTGAVNLSATAPAWAPATYYEVGRSVAQSSLYTCVVAHTSSGTFANDYAAGYWKLETVFDGANVGGYFQISHIRNSASLQQSLAANGTSTTLEASGKCTFDTYGTWSADVDLERSDDGGTVWYKVRTITSRSDNNGSIELTISGTALFRIVVSNYGSSTGTPRAVFTIVDSQANGLVRITSVGSAVAATAEVVTRLYSTAATNIWAEGAWSNRRGYPQAITAFQQRMIYGGSSYEPQRIWGTQTNDLENFDLGDSTLPTDGFAFDLAAIGRGRIQWIIGQLDLFVGFSAAEWIVNAGHGSFGGSNEPITPSQINAGEHSSWGSAEGVPPALVGNEVLYTQRTAKTIQQMAFSVYTNRYMSNDLTSLSDHLFGSGLVQISYQPQFRDQGIVWGVNRAGALLGMTYDMQAEIFAWHRHVTGVSADQSSIKHFESVACIDGQGTDDDELWVVVERASGRCIELMNPAGWETAGSGSDLGVSRPDIKQAIYADAAVTYEYPASNIFTGLDHLNGVTVVGVLNGNINMGTYVVVGGQITVGTYDPQPGNLDVVHIGVPMPYALQSMRMDVDPRAGVLMGVTKALSRVFIRLYKSLGGKVKGDGEKLVPIVYRLQSTPITEAPELFTGQKELVPESTQSDNPTFIVQGDDPFPVTVLATVVRIGITGSA